MLIVRTALALVLNLLWATLSMAAPLIAVDSTEFNFGSVQQGKSVEHLFMITNRGDAPLAIKSVRPSCGCTAVSTTSSVISPGKTGGIKSTFNSANFADAISKSIAVETNDPKIPVLTLTLKGTVIESVKVNLKQLNLGRIKINETTSSTIVVSNMGTSPLKLTAVKSTLAQLSATSEKRILNPGESSIISISATPHSGDRILSGYISILTDNPAKPELLVPVYGSPVP